MEINQRKRLKRQRSRNTKQNEENKGYAKKISYSGDEFENFEQKQDSQIEIEEGDIDFIFNSSVPTNAGKGKSEGKHKKKKANRQQPDLWKMEVKTENQTTKFPVIFDPKVMKQPKPFLPMKKRHEAKAYDADKTGSALAKEFESNNNVGDNLLILSKQDEGGSQYIRPSSEESYSQSIRKNKSETKNKRSVYKSIRKQKRLWMKTKKESNLGYKLSKFKKSISGSVSKTMVSSEIVTEPKLIKRKVATHTILPNELLTQTKSMKDLLSGTVSNEKKISSKLLAEVEKIRGELPIEFLMSINMRDYCLQRGAKVVSKVFGKLFNQKQSIAFEKWIEFTKSCNEQIKKKKLEDYAKTRGVNILKNILQAITNQKLSSGLNSWKNFVFSLQFAEQNAAILEIQRILRGHFGRQASRRMILQKLFEKQSHAAETIQRAVRAFQAVTIANRIRLQLKRDDAASSLQRFFRIVVAKGKFQRRMNFVILEKKRENAAMTIQSFCRWYLARRMYDELKSKHDELMAIIKLQSWFRMEKAKSISRQYRDIIATAACEELVRALQAAEEHMAALTLQNSYSNYVDKSRKEMAAFIAIDTVLAVESKLAAITVQNHFRNMQIKNLVDELTSKVDRVLFKATITLQTATRGKLARNALHNARLEDRARRHAAVKLQAGMRGKRDRDLANKRREERRLRLEAERKRQLLIAERLRQRILAFMNKYQTVCMRNHLFVWRAYKDYMHEEREKQKLLKALNVMKNHLVRKAIQGWKWYRAERMRKKAKLRKAIAFMQRALTMKSIVTWKECCQQSREHKLLLSKVFLCCVDVNAFNSKRQRRLLKLSHGLLVYHKGTWMLDRWSALMDYRRRQMKEAAIWYSERWYKRAQRMSIDAWISFVKHCKEKKEKLKKAYIFWISCVQKKYIKSWVTFVAIMKKEREMIAKAIANYHHATKRRGYNRWLDYLEQVREYKRNMQRALLMWKKQQYLKSFNAWKEALEIAKEKRRKIQQAIMFSQRKIEIKVFQAWFQYSNAKLFEKMTAASLKIQCLWRKRKSRKVLNNLKILLKYKQERLAKEQEQERMRLEKEKRTMKSRNFDEISHIVNEYRNIALIITVPPWATKEQLAIFEKVEAAVSLALHSGNMHPSSNAVKVFFTPQYSDWLTQLGVKTLPALTITWSGQSLARWSEVFPTTWKTIEQAGQSYFGKSKDGAINSNHLTLTTENVISGLNSLFEEIFVIENNASKKIQRNLLAKWFNRTMKKWRYTTEDVVHKDKFEKEQIMWSETSWRDYKDNIDREKTFWFNHKTTQSRWDTPREDEEIPVVIVFRTGHRIDMKLKPSETVGNLKEKIFDVRGVPPSHQRLAIRPEGISWDFKIITGINNRQFCCQMGVGMHVEYLDVSESSTEENNDEDSLDEKNSTFPRMPPKNTWKKGVVMKVYENKDVDVNDNGNKVSLLRNHVRLPELKEDFNLGASPLFVRHCVIEIEEIEEQDEEMIHPALCKDFQHALQCVICMTKVAELCCIQCKEVFCEECIISEHYRKVNETDVIEEVPDDSVSIDEEEAYYNAIKREKKRKQRIRNQAIKATHTFVTMDSFKIARELEACGYEEPTKAEAAICCHCQVCIADTLCSTCGDGFCSLCSSRYHSLDDLKSHKIEKQSGFLWREEVVDEDEARALFRKRSRKVKDSVGLRMQDIIANNLNWTTNFYEKLKKDREIEKERKWQEELEKARAFLWDAFVLYDADKSGTMESSELGELMRQELCEPVSEAEVEEAMKEIDADGNGTIEFEEFLSWFVRLTTAGGRESMKIKLLRRRLQAKKKYKELKAKYDAMRERMRNKEKPKVPGWDTIYQISLEDDFDTKKKLLKRWANREFGLDASINSIERTKLVFSSVFMPAWNKGELSTIYYYDGREYQYKEKEYTSHWDEESDRFYYIEKETNIKTWINPELDDIHREKLKEIFDTFDSYGAGTLDRDEISAMCEKELCIKMTEAELDEAYNRMTPDGESPVNFEDFLTWYCAGIDVGEYGGGKISPELTRKKAMRGMNQKREAAMKSMKVTAAIGKDKLKAAMSKAKVVAQSQGKNSIYKDLILDGWDKNDVEKGIDRCGKKKATREDVEKWLSKYATVPKKKKKVDEVEDATEKNRKKAKEASSGKRAKRKAAEEERKQDFRKSINFLDQL